MHLHDLRIGARVRQRRLELGMSQAALAKQLRLTFQQIQKYENGINRISASTLIEVARALKAPAAWFLEEASSSSEQLISGVDGLAALARELIRDNTADCSYLLPTRCWVICRLRSISSIPKGD